MRNYIIRRLLLMIPTVFLVSIIVFLSVRFIPGDVIDIMASEMAMTGVGAGMEVKEWLSHELGLDVAIHIQFGRWLGMLPPFEGVFQGDLGNSLWRGIPVTQIMLERLPITIELGVIALIAAVLIALPIGVYSAIRQDTGGDYIGRIIAVLCISLPSFWLGTLVITYPSIWWSWAPELFYIPLFEDPSRNLVQFIIPGVILGMVMSGTTCRMTRTMMLEVLRQDYIRTAWAKGLTERVVIVRHALKNALIPVVSMIGLLIVYLIGGAVVIEQIFILPGIGHLMYEALTKRDYPLISGIMIIVALGVLIINLLTDLTYAYLDPRVKYG